MIPNLGRPAIRKRVLIVFPEKGRNALRKDAAGERERG